MLSLPPELWRQVIRHAIHEPHLFLTSWDYDVDEDLWQGWDEWEKLRRVPTSTKVAIMLVCRNWRDFGAECLYESIHIPLSWTWIGRTNLRRLVDTLDVSASASRSDVGLPMEQFGYGWWIKRIDCQPEILLDAEVEDLFALLERCPNLRIFIVKNAGINLNPRILIRLAEFLQSRFLNSLCRLGITPTLERNLKASDAKRESLLPNVTLTCLDIVVRLPPDFPFPSTFKNITTLTVTFWRFLREPPPWYFPCLRTLGLKNVPSQDFPLLLPFIQRHRSTLRHLSIHESYPPYDDMPALFTGLRSVVLSDSNFTKLTIRADQGHPMLPLIGLTHIGVTSLCAADSSARIRDGMLRIFGKGLGAFPDLRVVRVLVEANPISSNLAAWQETMDIGRGYGVRLEDLHGRTMQVIMDEIRDSRIATA